MNAFFSSPYLSRKWGAWKKENIKHSWVAYVCFAYIWDILKLSIHDDILWRESYTIVLDITTEQAEQLKLHKALKYIHSVYIHSFI